MSLLEKSSSVELSRRTQPFYAKQQSYALGRQVQIEVDTQREFLDFENARLVFDIEYTQVTDSYMPNPWTASATIENLRVKTLSGQMIGHEIRDYNAWSRMKKELMGTNESSTSYNTVLEGADTVTRDLALWTQEYAHKLEDHIFSVKEYYPAHFHQGIMIEYDLPSSANAIVRNDDVGTTALLPTILIKNCKFVCDLVQVKPELENEMVRMMEEQKLFVDYEEVLAQRNGITGTAGLQAFDLVGIDGRVKSAFTIVIADADISAGTDSDKDPYGIWARNDLASYRYKLGSHYLNYQSIPVEEKTAQSQRAEQVFELLKALDLHAGNKHEFLSGGAGLTGAAAGTLETTRFAVGVKVDRAQSNTSESISSMVDKDRNNMRVELTFRVSPGTGNAFTFVKLDKRLQMLPGSVVRNVRS